MKISDIAKICHQANKTYCESIGDFSQSNWEFAPDWQKDSAIIGVSKILEGKVESAGDSHISWMNQKVADGWTYGEIKHEGNKTHPCMVPFSQLPKNQQAKDHLFLNIVKALMPYR